MTNLEDGVDYVDLCITLESGKDLLNNLETGQTIRFKGIVCLVGPSGIDGEVIPFVSHKGESRITKLHNNTYLIKSESREHNFYLGFRSEEEWALGRGDAPQGFECDGREPYLVIKPISRIFGENIELRIY